MLEILMSICNSNIFGRYDILPQETLVLIPEFKIQEHFRP